MKFLIQSLCKARKLQRYFGKKGFDERSLENFGTNIEPRNSLCLRLKMYEKLYLF